jgi:hypothetical protein
MTRVHSWDIKFVSLYQVLKNDPVRLPATRFKNAMSCFEPGPRSLAGTFFKHLVGLLGTRFTNAVNCLEHGPQEPYGDICLNTL